MRAEATEADHLARAEAVAAYNAALVNSGVARQWWDDALLSAVEYAESRMVEAITEARLTAS